MPSNRRLAALDLAFTHQVRLRIANSHPCRGARGKAMQPASTISIAYTHWQRSRSLMACIPSLNRPGGNITGATFFSNLLTAKRLELLHQLVPNANVIAVLLNPKNLNVELEKKETQEAARALGLQLVPVQASTEREIDDLFANLAQQHVGGVLASGDVLFSDRRQQIAELAVRHTVPTCFAGRLQVVAGGLMSYGARNTDTFRQAGNYVGRILKGEKPSELPVQQPTKLEFGCDKSQDRQSARLHTHITD